MIEKIVMFMPQISQYGVLHGFTKELAAAFKRLNIDCVILDDNQNLVQQIFRHSPDCTLSFNGLLPDSEGRFLCDVIQIPHVACLVDPPFRFLAMKDSPYTIIAIVDRFFADFFSKVKHAQTLFMPHAVSKDLFFLPNKKREYDVAMIASYIDSEAIGKNWKKIYSKEVVKALEVSAEICLSDQTTSFIEALTKNLGNIPLSAQLFNELELYIKGIDRLKLLHVLQGNFKIHLFGGGVEGADWRKVFPKIILILLFMMLFLMNASMKF